MNALIASLVSVVLAMSVSCGNGDEPASPAPDSGIRGIVMSGPSCPVIVEGSPCPDRPWEGTVRVSDADSQVADVPTDAKGRFTLMVVPGTYDVIPLVEGADPGFARPERVRVTDGDVVEVDLSVDTGIR